MKAQDRIAAILAENGIDSKILEYSTSTRTAQEAADTVGCEVGQIVKSLVFRLANSNDPILILTSGSNRVDEERVSKYIGEALAKADAKFVREHTGYAIGGVSPLGHPRPMRVLIDESLFQYPIVWAAAGDPFHVFSITPPELEKVTGGKRLIVHN